MIIEILPCDFSICKVTDYSKTDLSSEFVFIGKTDNENSLVCLSDMVPDNAVICDNGWMGFRICGTLDFSLVGILSKISAILAENKISIFAVSTFNTDYVFTKKDNFDSAVSALAKAGYETRGIS